MGGPRFHAAQFIKAIPGTAGIVTTIAKRVGCTWHTARRYIDRHPTVAKAYADECETLTDIAEAKLYAQINKGEMWAVKYYLSTKGKNRGYTTRVEHSGPGGEAIPVDVNHNARGALAQLLARQSAALAAGEGDSGSEPGPSE